jgi:hypothetical protein
LTLFAVVILAKNDANLVDHVVYNFGLVLDHPFVLLKDTQMLSAQARDSYILILRNAWIKMDLTDHVGNSMRHCVSYTPFYKLRCEVAHILIPKVIDDYLVSYIRL